MGKILVANIRHYLAQQQNTIQLPAPAARLRDYLGSIIEAVTSRELQQDDYVTHVRCRRRPKHRRCEEEIIAHFDEAEPSAIKWFCPFCGDGGYIRGWEGTAWDKTALNEDSKGMAEEQPNTDRERRISMKIVVDAYDECERAMGWYYYLQDHLKFPFAARCIGKRATSPLRVKGEVEVLNMAPEEECEQEMFVMIKWDKGGLAVPLSQLRPIDVDGETAQAVEDWHYWVSRGYRF